MNVTSLRKKEKKKLARSQSNVMLAMCFNSMTLFCLFYDNPVSEDKYWEEFQVFICFSSEELRFFIYNRQNNKVIIPPPIEFMPEVALLCITTDTDTDK